MTPEEKLAESEKFKEKFFKRHYYGGLGAIAVFSGLTVYMVVGVIIPRDREKAKEQAKQIIIDKKVKEYQQTLPYYQEYLQTKEQIIHYRDSLQRTMK